MKPLLGRLVPSLMLLLGTILQRSTGQSPGPVPSLEVSVESDCEQLGAAIVVASWAVSGTDASSP